MKEVAKVFIQVGEDLVFSRKRAPGEEKDGRLELLGGTLEAGEAPLEAMVREAEEEESSGELARTLRARRPDHEKIVLHGSGVPEPQYLFRITIDAATADLLAADPGESHGLERVPVDRFESEEGLREMRDEFTPKSLAIFRAMGRDV